MEEVVAVCAGAMGNAWSMGPFSDSAKSKAGICGGPTGYAPGKNTSHQVMTMTHRQSVGFSVWAFDCVCV